MADNERCTAEATVLCQNGVNKPGGGIKYYCTLPKGHYGYHKCFEGESLLAWWSSGDTMMQNGCHLDHELIRYFRGDVCHECHQSTAQTDTATSGDAAGGLASIDDAGDDGHE